MNNQQKSASIHHHYHYHHHYDIDDQPHQARRKSTSKGLTAPKQNEMKNSTLSWKNHIDPQVTRLYDEILQNQQVQGDLRQRTSIQYLPKRVSTRLTPPVYNNEQSPLTQSRIQLFQQLQLYEDYLKKCNVQNLYVPDKASFIKEELANPQKFTEKISTQNTLDDLIRNKVDSKILYGQKMFQSSTAKDSHTGIKESQIIYTKREGRIGAQSEIKISRNEQILQKQKNTTSQIIRPSNENKFYQENHEFSLFPKSVQQESYIRSKEGNYQSLSQVLYEQDEGNMVSPYFKTKDQTDDHFDQYKYELVKEQCEFLRAKFIQHIESIHGLKF